MPGQVEQNGSHGDTGERQSIIIVGAGGFGSSLALELATNYKHKLSCEMRFAKVDINLFKYLINGPFRLKRLRQQIVRK
jgi:hypothetical protein